MSDQRSHIAVEHVEDGVKVNLVLSRDDLAHLVEGPISLIPDAREDPADELSAITVDLLREPAR